MLILAFGIKSIQELMMQDGFLIIMILFWFMQKIRKGGNLICYQELKKVQKVIRIQTMILEAFGHLVHAMQKHQMKRISIQLQHLQGG